MTRKTELRGLRCVRGDAACFVHEAYDSGWSAVWTDDDTEPDFWEFGSSVPVFKRNEGSPDWSYAMHPEDLTEDEKAQVLKWRLRSEVTALTQKLNHLERSAADAREQLETLLESLGHGDLLK